MSQIFQNALRPGALKMLQLLRDLANHCKAASLIKKIDTDWMLLHRARLTGTKTYSRPPDFISMLIGRYWIEFCLG